jgi:outer membrane protein assembly factor BamB
MSDGTVLAASNDGKVHAITAEGAAKWTFTLTPPAAGELSAVNPVLGPDGAIYVGVSVLTTSLEERRKMYALRRDGTEAFNRVDQGVPGAVGADGAIYLPGSTGDAFAMRADGTQLWTGKVTLQPLTRAAIGADGTVYFTSGAIAVGP